MAALLESARLALFTSSVNPISASDCEPLSKSIDYALQHAWAPGTLKGYNHGVNNFRRFCRNAGISANEQLPASEFNLCAFAAASAGLRSGKTARNDINGVRAWHIANDVPYAGSTRLSYVLRGVQNLTPKSSKRLPRPPVTSDMLIILHQNLDLALPFDAACLAAADTAHWGQARLGELLPATEAFYDPQFHPAVSDLLPLSVSHKSRKLRLPWTKTTKFAGAHILLCQQIGPSDPLAALDNHILVNRPPTNYPLFSYRNRTGHIALTKRKFLARCNEIWSAFGFKLITGHCFRIGGTTELLMRGVPPHIVKMMGRWSSDAFLTYWRELELIAPQYAVLLEPIVAPAVKLRRRNKNVLTARQ